MALLYICPMDMNLSSRGMAMAVEHGSCENTAFMAGASSLSKFNTTGNCMDARLALVGQTLNNLISTFSSFYLLAVLSIFVLYFFARKLLMNRLGSLFVRLRYFCRRYRTSIKVLTEIKIRQYLILLGNYTVVSIG